MEVLNMPPSSVSTLMRYINHENLPAKRNEAGIWVADSNELAKWAGAKTEADEPITEADAKSQEKADEAKEKTEATKKRKSK